MCLSRCLPPPPTLPSLSLSHAPVALMRLLAQKTKERPLGKHGRKQRVRRRQQLRERGRVRVRRRNALASGSKVRGNFRRRDLTLTRNLEHFSPPQRAEGCATLGVRQRRTPPHALAGL